MKTPFADGVLHSDAAVRVARHATTQQHRTRGVVKVINEAIHGVECVVAYLNHMIVFDAGPTDRISTTREYSERLPQYKLKLFPTNACLGAPKVNFLGHTIPPASVSANADKKIPSSTCPRPKT